MLTRSEDILEELKVQLGYLGFANYNIMFDRKVTFPGHEYQVALVRDISMDITKPYEIAQRFCDEIYNSPHFTSQLERKDDEINELKKELEELKRKVVDKALEI